MDSTTVGKSTEQIRDSMDSLKSTPINQEQIGHPSKDYEPIGHPSKDYVDPHRQDTQELRNMHNLGLEAERLREQERLQAEREQLSSEHLKQQLFSDQAKLHQIQTALKKDLVKVEKEQAKLEGKQGFVDKVKDSLATGLVSAKDRIIGIAPEPVVGDPEGSTGMPGRYHPDPAPLEAGLTTRIGDSVKGGLATAQAGLTSATTRIGDSVKEGLATAQAGLTSAKDRVVGPTVEPIESGMPARYHPQPELYETTTPGLMEKIKGGLMSAQTTAQAGLASVQSSAQTGLDSAKEGLARMRSSEPETQGMPGRYHPRATELEHHPAGPIWKATEGGSEVEKESLDLDAAKDMLEREFTPVAGMPGPGRNHPNPETLETPTTGVATKIGSAVQSGLQYAKGTLASVKDQYVGAVTRQAPPTAEFPLEARSEVDKEHIRPAAAQETLEQILPQKMEDMPGAGRYHPHPESLENLGLMDKMKIGLTSAKDAAQAGLVAAKDSVAGGLTYAKDKLTAQPSVAAQPSVVPSKNIDKDHIDTAAARDTLEQILPDKMEDMPGAARYHPHPESLENLGLMDKVKIGLESAKESAQAGLVAAKDSVAGLMSSKDKISKDQKSLMPSSQPRSEIEKDSIDTAAAKETLEQILPSKMEDMPGAGRYHPHPESLENLGLMDKMKIGLTSAKDAAQAGLVAAKDTVAGGLTYAKGGLISAKDTVVGPTVEPIETGMPGRNHPQPESFEAPAPGVATKVADTVKSGMAAVKETAQPYLQSAKDTAQPYLQSAKDAITPTPTLTVAPAASLAVAPARVVDDSFLMAQDSALLNAQASLINAQIGLMSAQAGLLAAKGRVPIEEPARPTLAASLTQAPAPSLGPGLMTRIGEGLGTAKDTAQAGLISAKDTAQAGLISAKDTVQAGLASTPGLAQDMKTGLTSGLVAAKDTVTSAKDTVVGGLVAAKDRIVGPGEVTHPGMFLEPVSEVDSQNIDQSAAKHQLEQTLPPEAGRNHPDAASFKAQDAGLMSKIGSTVSAAKEAIVGKTHSTVHALGTVPLDRTSTGPQSEIVRDSIDQPAVRQKMEETLAEGQIDPLGGVLAPGRNHPDADSLKAHDQGLLSSITDKLKQVFIGDKHEST